MQGNTIQMTGKEYDDMKSAYEVIYRQQNIEIYQYKQSYYMTLFFNGLLAVGCAILAAYIIFHKHDPQPVQQAAVSEEEYQEVVQKEQQAQAEKATLRKQLADEHARRLLADKRIKSLNMTVAQHQQQLKDLQVSVPPQPIILEAIRKEAATEKGLRQAVARSFGGEIAGRIEVR